MGLSKEEQKTGRETSVVLERHPALVIIRDTPKGRGIFATRSIAAGTIVEACPVLVFPFEDLAALETTFADHYSYNWPFRDQDGKLKSTQAMALGLGSIFNHSRNQNVGFQRDVERELIVYRTLRDVEQGEELCINYGPRLWFNDTDDGHLGPAGIEEEIDLLDAIQLDFD